MKNKKYVSPATEVVHVFTKRDLMFPINPNESTTDVFAKEDTFADNNVWGEADEGSDDFWAD